MAVVGKSYERKLCRKCGSRRSITQFYKNYAACKSCTSKYNKEWRINNPDKAKAIRAESNARCAKQRSEYNRQWRKANPKKCAVARERWRANNRGRYLEQKRWVRVKAKYGLTQAEFESLLNEQDNKCAICKVRLSSGKNSPRLDHNHSTGRFRGILCNNCNAALGMLKDDACIVAQAEQYLKKHNTKGNR